MVHPKLHIYVAFPHSEDLERGFSWKWNSPEIKRLKMDEDALMRGIFSVSVGLAGWEVGIWVSLVTY